MKTFFYRLPTMLLLFSSVSLNGEEGCCYKEEEHPPCCQHPCEEPCQCTEHCNCRRPRRRFYDYQDRSDTPTWPGKMEDSFMDAMMR